MVSPRYLHPIMFRNLASTRISPVGTKSAGTDCGKAGVGEWQSRLFTLSLPSSHCGKEELYKMEYGEARLYCPSSAAPAIMAVHPSGSSYRQWSGLTEYIPAGSCSGLYGINLFGYGRSEAWRRKMRPSTTEDLVSLLETATEHVEDLVELLETATEHVEDLVALLETATEHVEDLVALLETATEHVDPSRRWHLIGHSMGGGVVLAAAASGAPLVDKLDAVTVFEPNLFNLLLAGNEDEKKVYDDATAFSKAMLAAAEEKNWEKWGRLFFHFWFVGKWESLPEEVRKTLIQTTLPQTVYEFESLMSAAVKGPREGEKMLNNLAKLECAKKMVISHEPGEGSKEFIRAMGNLLQRQAGFQIVHAPAGGHMGPLTHKHQVLPLLL